MLDSNYVSFPRCSGCICRRSLMPPLVCSRPIELKTLSRDWVACFLVSIPPKATKDTPRITTHISRLLPSSLAVGSDTVKGSLVCLGRKYLLLRRCHLWLPRGDGCCRRPDRFNTAVDMSAGSIHTLSCLDVPSLPLSHRVFIQTFDDL